MNTGISTRRTTLSKLGTVSTRLGGGTDSMSRDLNAPTMRSAARTVAKRLAEHSGQAQGGQRVIRQRVVVDHVRPRRSRPRQLGQIQPLLLFEHVCRLKGLLCRLDRVGGQ